MSDISVIIAVKNRKRNLDYCLRSISLNTHIPNVLIVDFGSDTEIIYPEYSFCKTIRITEGTSFFHKAKAYNIGISGVTTNYICLTDADQIFQNNFYSVINKHLKYCAKGVLKCKTYKVKQHPNFSYKELNVNSYSKLLDTAKKQSRLYGDGCLHVTETDFLRKIGGLDEKFIGWGAEDCELSWRSYVLKKSKIDITPETSMIHLPHEKTNTRYYDDNRRLANREYYFAKIKNKIYTANTSECEELFISLNLESKYGKY